MIITESDGRREVAAANLDGTSFVTLVDCERNEHKTLESLVASCDGTGTDFTLVFNDGTTDFYIANAEAIAANDSYRLVNFHFPIRPGQKLKVKASAVDHISVTAVVITATSKKDQGGSGRG